MRALRLVPLLLAAAAGCGVEFTPRSVVVDTRVLAIVATPLEVGPYDSVTLTAWRVGPPHVDRTAERIASERWSFCPFSVGSTAGYACAVPECEELVTVTQPDLAIGYGPSNALTASPGDLARQCVARLAASGTLPPGVPADPAQWPSKVEVLFRYHVTAAGSREREAVQRIPLYPAGAPTGADANKAPVIVTVRIGDTTWRVDPNTGAATTTDPGPTLPSRGTLDVLVSVTGAQKYSEGGRELVEQLVVSFYTTAGRFDYDWANGPDASVKLKNEDAGDAPWADVWVVARDLRGGEAVQGPFQVTITR